METLTEKSLYSAEVHQECLERIGKLASDTQPQWGKMSVAQMLAHCAEIQEVANGKELKNTPFIARLFKGMIRNMVLNNKPFPKSTKTHPQYLQTAKRDFEREKNRLLAAVDTFVSAGAAPGEHPFFGPMTAEEKGWSMYKHLDHHLQQFGV